jgi:hypothetical protein
MMKTEGRQREVSRGMEERNQKVSVIAGMRKVRI